MIVERFALGTVKNLNRSEDFALGEGINGTFKTEGREERPIFFGFNLTSDLMRNNTEFKSPRSLRVFCNDFVIGFNCTKKTQYLK